MGKPTEAPANQEESQSMLPPSAPPSYEQSQQSQQQQQGPPQPQQVQIIQEIRYVQAPSFSYRPDTMVCPHCQTQIKTSTKKSLSLVGWGFVIGLCFFQACLCACIPCCMDSCHKVVHYCPKCDTKLGTYNGPCS